MSVSPNQPIGKHGAVQPTEVPCDFGGFDEEVHKFAETKTRVGSKTRIASSRTIDT
jgi:hypothetical protein